MGLKTSSIGGRGNGRGQRRGVVKRLLYMHKYVLLYLQIHVTKSILSPKLLFSVARADGLVAAR